MINNCSARIDSEAEQNNNIVDQLENKFRQMPNYELALWILCILFGTAVAGFQLYEIIQGKE